MKKRSLVFALLASMMLSMTACGSDASETNVEVETRDVETGEVETGDVEAETDVEEETEAESGTDLEEDFEVKKAEAEEVDAVETEDAEAEAEEESEEEVEEETEEATDDYVKGSINGNVFESEWMGIRFEAPEGYGMATEEELEEVLTTGSEVMYEENAEEVLDYTKQIAVYEMMAQENSIGIPSVTLTVMYMPISFESQDIMQSTVMQVESVEGVSLTMLNEEPEMVELAGREFEKYVTEMNYGGIVIMQDYYFAFQGDRIIYINTTYTDEAAVEELMSGFSAY